MFVCIVIVVIAVIIIIIYPSLENDTQTHNCTWRLADITGQEAGWVKLSMNHCSTLLVSFLYFALMKTMWGVGFLLSRGRLMLASKYSIHKTNWSKSHFSLITSRLTQIQLGAKALPGPLLLSLIDNSNYLTAYCFCCEPLLLGWRIILLLQKRFFTGLMQSSAIQDQLRNICVVW